jgi:hypothetical protein
LTVCHSSGESSNILNAQIPGKQMPSEWPSDMIYVVSGLPRSGTSLMMQILLAAGIPAFTDARRQADLHNPAGYFEHETVKNVIHDSAWLAEAQGKAVKIIADFLHLLPPDFRYQIIFMRRDLDEVIDSQNKMLRLSGNNTELLNRQQLRDMLRHTLARAHNWAGGRQNIRIYYQDYAALIANPDDYLPQIARFIGGAPNQAAMLSAVKSDLYRTRKANRF